MKPSVLIRASAGTGKTYQLVQAYCAAILDGLAPTEVVAITFTRKAADELRGRIRSALMSDTLRATLVQQGRYAEVLADLGRAPIGNFHVLSLQLLRQYGAAEWMPEGTEVMGEAGEDRRLFVQVAEDAWFAGTNAELNAAVRRVSMYFAIEDLPSALWDALSRAREDAVGLEARAMLGAYDSQGMKQSWHARLVQLQERLQAALPECTAKAADCVREFMQADVSVGLSVEEWRRGWLRAVRKLNLQTNLKKHISKHERDALLAGLDAALAESLCEQLTEPMTTLVDAALTAYRYEKRRRRLVDFGDLVEGAVELLSNSPEVHREVRTRFRTVLVDEAQDTNRLQTQLVGLLAGWHGPAQDIELATVCVVGDWKQSIYTFRGADPESFHVLGREVLERGGTATTLATSRRSTAGLVRSINHLGCHLFADDYEALQPLPEKLDDDNVACRWVELPSDSPNTGEQSAVEARVIAAYLAAQIQGGRAPGDFAILLAAMGRAPFFAQELAKAGVPVVLGGGGGLYAQTEIADVIALLAWLADPSDRLSAAVALRSPIFGFSDNLLHALLADDSEYRGGERDQGLNRLRQGAWAAPECASAEERAALTLALGILPRLVTAARLMPVDSLMEYADSLLHFRAVYLALSGGEQRLANLDRLLVIAGEFHRRGRGGLLAFAKEQLLRLHTNFAEPLSTVLAAERRAVIVGTVHQAKGLEFPVVLLPELGRRSRNDTASVRYSREHGLVIKPKFERDRLTSERWQSCAAHTEKLEADERRRLLYVAVTRAKEELLFFAHPTPKSCNHGFLSLLWPWQQQADEEVLQRVAHQEGSPAPEEPKDLATPEEVTRAQAWAQEVVRGCQQSAHSVTARLVLPVTQLETFLQCQRRGALRHQWGIPEATRSPKSVLAVPSPGLDPRERGRLAHRILAEMDDVANFASCAAFVDEKLRAAGFAPGDPQVKSVRTDVEKFLLSDFGRMLVNLPSAQRRHEMPFELRLPIAGCELVLVGQIDLLFDAGEGPVVVDYKHALPGPEGLLPYVYQLDAYALAVAKLCSVRGTVPTRLVFLREPEALYERSVDEDAQQTFLEKAEGVLQHLLQSDERTALPDALDQGACTALGCGFLSWCHASAPAVAQWGQD